MAPTFETIASGDYGISRPLFFYIKNAHRNVIAGMNDYITEFVSDDAMGPEGYLSERGLVALPDDKRKAVQEAAKDSTGMTRFTN